MRIRRIIVIGAAVLLGVAAGGAVIWKLKHPTATGPDGTSVRQLASCSKELTWDQPSKIVSISNQTESLVVTVLVNAPCGGIQPVEPETKVEGQNVKLSWFWNLPKDEWVAACLCTRRLEFVAQNAGLVATPKVSLGEVRWKE